MGKRERRPDQLSHWSEVQTWCFERDGYRCQARVRCVGDQRLRPDVFGLQAHHVRPRHRRGPDELGNLTSLCWACHQWVHTARNYAEAIERGLLWAGMVKGSAE